MPSERLSVVVTRRLPDVVENRLSELFDVTLREDDVTLATIGAEYRINRRWGIKSAYRYRARDTEPENFGGRVFNINEITIDLTYRL